MFSKTGLTRFHHHAPQAEQRFNRFLVKSRSCHGVVKHVLSDLLRLEATVYTPFASLSKSAATLGALSRTFRSDFYTEPSLFYNLLKTTVSNKTLVKVMYFFLHSQVEREAEVDKLRTKLDNLTAQLLGAEEMLEHKETDLRKLQEDNKSIASELETVPLLKQQVSTSQQTHCYSYAKSGRAYVRRLLAQYTFFSLRGCLHETG